MNLVEGRIERGVMHAGPLELVMPGAPDGKVVVGIRPEGFTIASSADHDGNGAGPIVEFVVSAVEALGNENLVHGSVPGLEEPDNPLVFRAPPRVLPRVGDRLRVHVDTAQLLLFDQGTEQRVPLTGPALPVADPRAPGER